METKQEVQVTKTAQAPQEGETRQSRRPANHRPRRPQGNGTDGHGHQTKSAHRRPAKDQGQEGEGKANNRRPRNNNRNNDNQGRRLSHSNNRSDGASRNTRNGSQNSNRNRQHIRTQEPMNPEITPLDPKGKLMIIPLGGLGEIGKNMTVFQYENDIVVLDAGLAFPGEDLHGVDIVIPDMSYLIENKDKVRAICITHGHEDHIGALSYLMRQVDAPVYATDLVCGLMENKLKENRVSNKNLNVIAAGDEIKAGCMTVGFIQTNHSIPDSCGIYFRTPVGTVVHTGDFKIDQTPVDGKMFDLHKFAELGNEGVLALMSDSTNVEKPGTTGSESTVGPALMKAVREAKGRVILATFASNVSRIQQAIDAAVKTHRKVVVMGRSMVNVTAIAEEKGYLNVPAGTIVEEDEMRRLPPNQVMVLTTGSQGEPMAGLSRMSVNNHRSVEINPSDTIIISATPIPGNEAAVGRTIDNLLRRGCNVVYGKDKGIHVSGHASQEELKIMLNLVRPEYFIPVHGEYRMLKKHGELGVAMGVDPDKILIGDNGQVFAFDGKTGKKDGRVQAGQVFVDGLGVGDVGNIVIRDRQQLAEEGMVIAVMAMDRRSCKIVSGPDLVSRGFVYVRDAEELMDEAQRRVDDVIDRCEAERIKDWTTIKQNVRDALGKFFYEKTRRRPMILPIIQDV